MPQARRCVVEPGIVLDELNRRAEAVTACGFRSTSRPPRAPPSAAWPATIPAAARSLRYGTMRDNVHRDRRRAGRRHASAFRRAASRSPRPQMSPRRRCCATCSPSRAREADEVERALSGSAAPRRRLQSRRTRGRAKETTSISRIYWSGPKAHSPSRPRIELKLSPLLGRRAVGACHFGNFTPRNRRRRSTRRSSIRSRSN